MRETRDRRELPPESPLEMPRQALSDRKRRERSWRFAPGVTLARVLLIGGTIALTGFGAFEMWRVISAGRATWPQIFFLVLFTINFLWIAHSAVQSTLGFVRVVRHSWFRGRRPSPVPTIRSAVLVPVYNEDPVPVRAAIEVMRAELAVRAPRRFDFFILSDTNQPDRWIEEEACYAELTASADRSCPVYYRRRYDNQERKAGNIAAWVRRFGAAYEGMVILDADSLMAPETLIALAHRLEHDPDLGLIQTLPAIINARTVFGRLQQFANRCYGVVFGGGLAAWHGRSSNFWGHNAIIRVRAFAESAKLPILEGPPPFGGPVMSHDFVEAAMLRRHGWGVRLDDDLEGSYEGAPPSVLDVLVRDRRWCQGNLQHARFLSRRGYRLLSRVHLATGVYSYLSALVWMAMILTGLLLAVQAALTRPEYFAEPGLLPTWPVFEAERAVRLFVASMALVLWPKLLGTLAVLLSWRRLVAFGGPILTLASVAFEIVLSALYAPVMMVSHCRIVWDVLRGKDAGWSPQQRDDGSVPFGRAMRAHVSAMMLGVVLTAAAWFSNPWLMVWLLPITTGLILAGPLSWLSASPRAGRLLKWFGPLRAPDETSPQPIIARYRETLARKRTSREEPALRRLARDPGLLRWHVAQQSPDDGEFCPERVLALAKAERSCTLEALQAWLTPRETLRLLESPELPRILARVRI